MPRVSKVVSEFLDAHGGMWGGVTQGTIKIKARGLEKLGHIFVRGQELKNLVTLL